MRDSLGLASEWLCIPADSAHTSVALTQLPVFSVTSLMTVLVPDTKAETVMETARRWRLLKSRCNSILVRSLFTELDVGITFCNLGLVTTQRHRLENQIIQAELASAVAARVFGKVLLTKKEQEDYRGKKAELDSSLDRLRALRLEWAID